MPSPYKNRRVPQPILSRDSPKYWKLCSNVSSRIGFCGSKLDGYRFYYPRGQYGLSFGWKLNEKAFTEMQKGFRLSGFYWKEICARKYINRHQGHCKKIKRIFLPPKKQIFRSKERGLCKLLQTSKRSVKGFHSVFKYSNRVSSQTPTLEYQSRSQTNKRKELEISFRCCSFCSNQFHESRENIVVALSGSSLYSQEKSRERKRVWEASTVRKNWWEFYGGLFFDTNKNGRQKKLEHNYRRTWRNIWSRYIKINRGRQRLLFGKEYRFHRGYEGKCGWFAKTMECEKFCQRRGRTTSQGPPSRYRTFDRPCKKIWIGKKQDEVRQGHISLSAQVRHGIQSSSIKKENGDRKKNEISIMKKFKPLKVARYLPYMGIFL